MTASRSLLIASLFVCVLGCSARAVEVAPRVERPADAGPPRVWPFYPSASGGDEIRNCHPWRAGWETFVERRALPTVRRHGRVWIHNPGGVVEGQAMRFQQFTECRQQAELSGDDRLAAISDWAEFSRQMSRVAADGELVIYIGCPGTMKPSDGETDEEWLRRALDEIEPILAIDPKPIVGFDATYGHPADPNRGAWGRLGGADGLVASVLKELDARGYEILVEHAILSDADWLNGMAGVIATDWYWETQLRDRDVRLPHHIGRWGRFFKPTELRGTQVRMLNQLWKKPDRERLEVIRATLDAGYDVAVGVGQANEWLAEE